MQNDTYQEFFKTLNFFKYVKMKLHSSYYRAYRKKMLVKYLRIKNV